MTFRGSVCILVSAIDGIECGASNVCRFLYGCACLQVCIGIWFMIRFVGWLRTASCMSSCAL